jgi:hypothetical protein
MLPEFCGDPASEETKKLLEKYKGQRAILNTLATQEHFLEKVLEKFYEPREE